MSGAPSVEMEDKSRDILKRFDAMKQDRDGTMLPLWQSIADYCVPRKGNIQRESTPSESYVQGLYSMSYMEALETLASGLTSASTPASEKWASFEAPAMLRARAGGKPVAANYYQSASEVFMAALAESNFYGEAWEHNVDKCAMGTGCFLTLEGKDTALRFEAVEIGSYVFANSFDGSPDTWGREFELTARQIELKFGEQALTSKMMAKLETPEGRQAKFMLVQLIEKRLERDSAKNDRANKPWSDVYVCRGDPEFVQEGGFDEFPVAISTFLRWPGEQWGWGPGLMALPLARQLNFIERMLDNALEKLVDPPMMVPSYLAGQVDWRAAGETVFDENKQTMPLPLHKMERIDALDLRIQAKEEKMRRIFHNDLFRAISDIEPGRMTAYETMQRVAEKMDRFAPAGSRQNSEFVTPVARRAFGILHRAGHFGQAPAEVMVGEGVAMPKVSFSSKLALALRSMENRALVDFMEVARPLVEVRPETLDNLDSDEAFLGMARNGGVPERWIRNPDKVRKERAVRAEMAAKEEALQASAIGAKAAGDLGKAPPAMQKRFEQMGANGQR